MRGGKSKGASTCLIVALILFSAFIATLPSQIVPVDALTDINDLGVSAVTTNGILSSSAVLEGIKVAFFSADCSAHDDECQRFVELGAVVTRLYPTDIAAIDLAFLRQFEVVYLAVGFASNTIDPSLRLRYAIEGKASIIIDYVILGGGLIVEQPNAPNYIPNVLPYPIKVTDVWWPTDSNSIVIVDPTHPITLALANEDMFGIADTVPIAEVDDHYHILTKTQFSDCLALAVLEYGSGRIAFHLGNWMHPALVGCPAPDMIIGRVFNWVARPVWEIPATINIDPDTLNLRSKGRWITAYIELPESYNVANINASTVMLNGTVPAQLKPMSIGDYDSDGIADLMVKFDRAAVQSMIKGAGIKCGLVALTVTGKLFDGTLFKGTDTIFVNHAGDVNKDGVIDMLDAAAVSTHWYPGPPTGPLGYDANADFNQDGTVDIADVGLLSSNWGPTVP